MGQYVYPPELFFSDFSIYCCSGLLYMFSLFSLVDARLFISSTLLLYTWMSQRISWARISPGHIVGWNWYQVHTFFTFTLPFLSKSDANKIFEASTCHNFTQTKHKLMKEANYSLFKKFKNSLVRLFQKNPQIISTLKLSGTYLQSTRSAWTLLLRTAAQGWPRPTGG